MPKSVRQIISSRVFTWLILVLAVATFNNWVISLFFHNSLILHGGEISELSVTGQPHALLFRSLDVISGILFVFFATLILFKTINKTKKYSVLIVTTVALGISNMLDALFPLRCSATNNPSCIININLNPSHFVFPSHGYSSVLIALCLLILPLFGFFIAKSIKSQQFKVISLVTFVANVLINLIVIYQYIINHTYRVPSIGIVSVDIQNCLPIFLLGVWFISWLLAFYSTKTNDLT